MNGKFKTYVYGIAFVLALAGWFSMFSAGGPVTNNFCQIENQTASTTGSNCVCPFEGLCLATLYNIMLTILSEFLLLFSIIVFIKLISFLLKHVYPIVGLIENSQRVRDAYGGFLNFRIRNYLALAFSTGILQPKIYS